MNTFENAQRFSELNSVASDMAFNGKYSPTGLDRVAKDSFLNAKDLETAKQMAVAGAGIGGTMAPFMGI